MRHDDRIHGEDRRAKDAGQDQVQHLVGRLQHREGHVGGQRQEARQHEHLAAVHPVREDAEGDLCDRPGQHRQAGKEGNRRQVEPDPVGIDRRKRAEGAVGDPHQEDRHHCHGRVLPQRPQVEPHGGQRRRCLRGGNGRGNEREAVEDRAEREKEKARGVAQGDDHLARRAGGEIDHRVDAEDAAPCRGLGPVIEPAFHDHRRACEAEARDRADRDPGPGFDHQRLAENGDGGDGAHHAEGADMPDRGHEARDEQASQHIANGPAGAQEAERGGAETLFRAAHRQDETVDAAGKEQERRAEQKRADGKKLTIHGHQTRRFGPVGKGRGAGRLGIGARNGHL